MANVYADPLYQSRWQREAYWRDESIRLDRINRQRARNGKPLARSLDEVKTRGRQV